MQLGECVSWPCCVWIKADAQINDIGSDTHPLIYQFVGLKVKKGISLYILGLSRRRGKGYPRKA